MATCRNPNAATGLMELKNKFAERLDIHRLDLTDDSTIEVLISAHSLDLVLYNRVVLLYYRNDVSLQFSYCSYTLSC